jgi:hypothetical protein
VGRSLNLKMRKEKWAPKHPMRKRSQDRLLNDMKLPLILVRKVESSGILKELIAQSTELLAEHFHQLKPSSPPIKYTNSDSAALP